MQREIIFQISKGRTKVSSCIFVQMLFCFLAKQVGSQVLTCIGDVPFYGMVRVAMNLNPLSQI
jgi:hypothetical protein